MDKSWIDYGDSNLENCDDKLKYAFAASAIWSAANESEDAAFNSKHAGNKELELITQLADIREILNK